MSRVLFQSSNRDGVQDIPKAYSAMPSSTKENRTYTPVLPSDESSDGFDGEEAALMQHEFHPKRKHRVLPASAAAFGGLLLIILYSTLLVQITWYRAKADRLHGTRFMKCQYPCHTHTAATIYSPNWQQLSPTTSSNTKSASFISGSARIRTSRTSPSLMPRWTGTGITWSHVSLHPPNPKPLSIVVWDKV